MTQTHTTHYSEGVTDPLVGSQRTTDSKLEASRTPEEEVTLSHHPHGVPQRSRGVAGALAILLGWLGAHRFYLGFRKVGMFQLLVSLSIIATAVIAGFMLGQTPLSVVAVATGAAIVMVLWGIFEGIFILTGVLEADANDHPLR